MRLVTWNCNMALHRKFEALLRLAPDVAVICECAEPERLRLRGDLKAVECDSIWIGQNPNKGLGVFAFNDYGVRLADVFYPTLRYVAPVHITGPTTCNLLAVWAQNASAGITQKNRAGPLRRALTKYRSFLCEHSAVVAGDLNNNAIWHRPGWRNNHLSAVTILERYGLVSAYHALRGERQGCESIPTIYWRDRKKDGPTYHLDYIFFPRQWTDHVLEMTIGTYEDWCGSGLSDHVPIVLDIDL